MYTLHSCQHGLKKKNAGRSPNFAGDAILLLMFLRSFLEQNVSTVKIIAIFSDFLK